MSVWAVPLAPFLSVFCPFLLSDVIVCPPASDATSVPSPLLSLLTLVSPSHGSKCLLREKVWGVWAECRAINAFTVTHTCHSSCYGLTSRQSKRALQTHLHNQETEWKKQRNEALWTPFCTYRGDMGWVETVSEWLQKSSTGFSLEQCWWLQEKIFKTRQLSDLVTSGLSLYVKTEWKLSTS